MRHKKIPVLEPVRPRLGRPPLGEEAMPGSLRSALYREAREAESRALARAWLKALRTLAVESPHLALTQLSDLAAEAAAKRFLGVNGARTVARTAREIRSRRDELERE